MKYFTGEVSFSDIFKSEREIISSSKYAALKYVISMFSNTLHLGLSDAQRVEIRALRLGGHDSNPRIKYAFVTDDAKVTKAIEQSAIDRQALHATKVLKSYEDALTWVGGSPPQ